LAKAKQDEDFRSSTLSFRKATTLSEFQSTFRAFFTVTLQFLTPYWCKAEIDVLSQEKPHKDAT
jgi:hypothetical protein